MRNSVGCSIVNTFRHKGLQKFFCVRKLGRDPADHASRLRMQLAALDTAQKIEDMSIPGFRLHPFKGREEGRWSIWVHGSWRLTFEFQNGDVSLLDYDDYH